MHGIKESHLKEIVLHEIRNVTAFARERTDDLLSISVGSQILLLKRAVRS